MNLIPCISVWDSLKPHRSYEKHVFEGLSVAKDIQLARYTDDVWRLLQSEQEPNSIGFILCKEYLPSPLVMHTLVVGKLTRLGPKRLTALIRKWRVAAPARFLSVKDTAEGSLTFAMTWKALSGNPLKVAFRSIKKCVIGALFAAPVSHDRVVVRFEQFDEIVAFVGGSGTPAEWKLHPLKHHHFHWFSWDSNCKVTPANDKNPKCQKANPVL